MNEYTCDILIAGGSFGGVSAALAAAAAGYSVILTEETGWIGGQATTQGVPLDEHPWIEQYGCTRSYRQFRNKVREYYRSNYPLTQRAAKDPYFNPGACWVSALGFEPRVGLAVLREMLAPYRANRRIVIWTHWKPVGAEMDGDTAKAVRFRSDADGEERVVSARYYLDATELGELLPLCGIEHVNGAESREETGEALAADKAEPLRQQPFTHLVALDYRPGEEHVISKPASYAEFQNRFSHISGRTDTRADSVVASRLPTGLFADENAGGYRTSLWNFRRYLYRGNFDSAMLPSDITAMMVGNEYADGVLCGVPADEAQTHLRRARELSLSLVYYLQTEVPDGYRGGQGYPGLRLRGDVYGTGDGLAQYPYIRESSRIRAEFTVLEQHFRIDRHPEGPFAYKDTVGLAGYRIDIHEKAKGSEESITSKVHGQHWTQQIPLGALIPIRVENVLPCCKNLGVTHVTNGSFRLHPVEWNIGEVAGALAAHCLDRGLSPRQVRNTPELLEDFQRELIRRGVELAWPQMEFSRSYFSHFRHRSGWYFGECDKLDSSVYLPRTEQTKETE